MKTKILADFQICISVHLRKLNHSRIRGTILMDFSTAYDRLTDR